MTEDAGSIVTVDGRIDPSELGVTLPHEHLSAWETEEQFDPPSSARERSIAREPLTLENRWYVRKNPSGVLANRRIDPIDDAVPDVERFHRKGGDAIVDVSSKNHWRDPESARAVARETGVTVVRGTSYYIRNSHPDWMDSTNVAELADELVSDVRDGIDDTDVRAGIIGEVGLSTNHEQDGIHNQEKKVLRASARAAVRTGASITIHPPARWREDRDPDMPSSRFGLEVVDIAEEEGLPANRIVMGHLDQSKSWLEDLTYQEQLADRGTVLEYDLFGHTNFMPGFADTQPSDPDRVQALLELIESGYEEQLLVSHDLYMKYLLSKYGGDGYRHILENVVPLLQDFGVDEETVDQLLVENPERVLTFEEPA